MNFAIIKGCADVAIDLDTEIDFDTEVRPEEAPEGSLTTVILLGVLPDAFNE